MTSMIPSKTVFFSQNPYSTNSFCFWFLFFLYAIPINNYKPSKGMDLTGELRKYIEFIADQIPTFASATVPSNACFSSVSPIPPALSMVWTLIILLDSGGTYFICPNWYIYLMNQAEKKGDFESKQQILRQRIVTSRTISDPGHVYIWVVVCISYNTSGAVHII